MTAADALRRLLADVEEARIRRGELWQVGSTPLNHLERLALDGLAGDEKAPQERCPIDWCSSINIAAAGMGVQTFMGPSPAPLRSMSIYCSEACRDASAGKRRQP